jgi:hypothetical protein
MDPAEAARVCAQAARVLSQALDQEMGWVNRCSLARDLAVVAERLNPAEAARVRAQTIRVLSQGLDQEKDLQALAILAESLAAVAGRMEPAEAAGVLSQALDQQKTAYARVELAKGLAAVAGRMDLAEAARLRAETARTCIQPLVGFDEVDWRHIVDPLSMVIQPLNSEAATRAARVLARQVVSNPDQCDSEVLERFFTHVPRPQVSPRAPAIVSAIGVSANGPVLSLPLLPAAGEPLPCRFSTQDLIELLKMPTCIGEVRRVVLDQLGHRYVRQFATHWDFVRYAQQQGLNLDFATPPQRPDRKLPPLFE